MNIKKNTSISRTCYFLMLSRKSNRAFLCFGVREDQHFSMLCWSSVRDTAPLPSSKNCERVMPRPIHILFSDWIVGVCFFLYQEDMVD